MGKPKKSKFLEIIEITGVRSFCDDEVDTSAIDISFDGLNINIRGIPDNLLASVFSFEVMRRCKVKALSFFNQDSVLYSVHEFNDGRYGDLCPGDRLNISYKRDVDASYGLTKHGYESMLEMASKQLGDADE